MIDWIEQASGRTLPRVAGPVAPPIDLGSGATATITIAPDDPLPGAQHTFEIATPPAEGTATIDATTGMLTYVASGGDGEAPIVVRVRDAATPARAASVTVDVMVAPPGGCACGAGGSATGAALPAAIALFALRRRRSR